MEKSTVDQKRSGQVRRGGVEFRSKLVEGVGAFIFAKDTGRYLFLLRTNGSWPMTWALPGGKLMPGEDHINGLSREIYEELGGNINDPVLIQVDKFLSKNNKFSYTTYFAPVDNEFLPFLNDEHIGYAWLPLANAPNPLHPGIYRTLKNPSVMDKIKQSESS